MGTRARIVQIGNSQGVRIPKTLLEQSELQGEVEIQAEPGRLIVTAVRRPRAGWSEAAKKMRARDEDRLLDEPTATEFDQTEWEW